MCKVEHGGFTYPAGSRVTALLSGIRVALALRVNVSVMESTHEGSQNMKIVKEDNLMSKALGARGHLIKLLPEEQLRKMSTPRLLNIHRKLTARTGFLHHCSDEAGEAWATKELETLKPFETLLHSIMATREHVERKRLSPGVGAR